jgi:hypothetical protein
MSNTSAFFEVEYQPAGAPARKFYPLSSWSLHLWRGRDILPLHFSFTLLPASTSCPFDYFQEYFGLFYHDNAIGNCY